MSHPWNPLVTAIPFDHPVLVRPLATACGSSIGEHNGVKVPFMVVRNAFDADNVDTMLGGNPEGYGWPLPISDLEAWLDVL